MKMKLFIIVIVLIISPIILYAGSAPILRDYSYEHDRWITLPRDIQLDFAAYTVSFDSEDDNNGDGTPDIWGIPEWVSFEIKELVIDHPLQNRPRWSTRNRISVRSIRCQISSDSTSKPQTRGALIE